MPPSPVKGRTDQSKHTFKHRPVQLVYSELSNPKLPRQSAIDKISLGPRLDALTAEKVFGWKNVHQYDTGAGKAPRVDIKCGVADGDSFGFEPKLVCS